MPAQEDQEKAEPEAGLPPEDSSTWPPTARWAYHQDQDEQAEFHHRHPTHRHEGGNDAFQASQEQPAQQGPQGITQTAQDADDEGL